MSCLTPPRVRWYFLALVCHTEIPVWYARKAALVVCLGLTSLSTIIFQSCHDGVWLQHGAPCSLLQRYLTEVCPRHLIWYLTQSHYPDTWLTSPSSTPYVWVPREEQLVPFLTTLVYCCPGSNLWPPVPWSGHSTNWATGMVKSCSSWWHAVRPIVFNFYTTDFKKFLWLLQDISRLIT